MDQKTWVVGAQYGPKSMGCASSIWTKKHGLWVPNVDQRAWVVLVQYGTKKHGLWVPNVDQRAWVVLVQYGPKNMGCGCPMWTKEHGLC